MSTEALILGIFDDYGAFLGTLRHLKAQGAGRIATYTPVPFHEVEELLREKPSGIRWFTLAGGLLGFGAGAALTVLAPMAYPLIVGGKPLISVPPNLIIAFELTILFSTILSAIGYFVLSPFRGPKAEAMYDPSFSEDRFGILVIAARDDIDPLVKVMDDHGAVETRTR